MTIPEHVIEAAAEAHYNSNQSRLGSWEWASFSTLSADAQQEYRDSIKSALSAGFASLWQPMASAPEDRKWIVETPWEFRTGVTLAYAEDTSEPLFLVRYVKQCPGVYGTDMWAPIPRPKGSE